MRSYLSSFTSRPSYSTCLPRRNLFPYLQSYSHLLVSKTPHVSGSSVPGGRWHSEFPRKCSSAPSLLSPCSSCPGFALGSYSVLREGLRVASRRRKQQNEGNAGKRERAKNSACLPSSAGCLCILGPLLFWGFSRLLLPLSSLLLISAWVCPPQQRPTSLVSSARANTPLLLAESLQGASLPKYTPPLSVLTIPPGRSRVGPTHSL